MPFSFCVYFLVVLFVYSYICIICISYQIFHPGLKAYIDGKPAKTMIVFPFYTAISVPEGTHSITFACELSLLKKLLIIFSWICIVFGVYIFVKKK